MAATAVFAGLHRDETHARRDSWSRCNHGVIFWVGLCVYVCVLCVFVYLYFYQNIILKLNINFPLFYWRGNSLHYAVRNGDETLFHILLGGDYIVALNQQNFEGNTPLHLAYANNVNNSSKDIIERLIMIGDVNASPCVNVVYVYEYMCVRVHVCVSHVMF
eukprot:m.16954 g.16954  ORF g.16954 m.16954 type:complete len:161 (+) comp8087_c0_seq1:391-873(+)